MLWRLFMTVAFYIGWSTFLAWATDWNDWVYSSLAGVLALLLTWSDVWGLVFLELVFGKRYLDED